MSGDWLYYFWAILLVVACSVCWFGTLVMLPGNWGIVALSALFAWLIPTEAGRGLSWGIVVALGVLAIAGEVIEGIAGAAGAAKRGGSRRGMALSLLGALVGSMVGVALGIPIPVIGSAVAAVAGGAMGAFVGAVLGEHWKGRPVDHQMQIGRAALFGRLWGTIGKLVVGIAMVVLVAADAIF